MSLNGLCAILDFEYVKEGGGRSREEGRKKNKRKKREKERNNNKADLNFTADGGRA